MDNLGKLESSFEDIEDLVKLPLKLLESRIISKDMKDKFVSLDQEHLDPDRKVRYLLQQVCERVREDGKVYDRLVRVLSKLGGDVKRVCEAMKELTRVEEGNASDGAEVGVCLTETDIPVVVELIVSSSHKCEEIGIALGLPEYVRDEYKNDGTNPSKLTRCLTAWISGTYDGVKAGTVDSLKAALSSKIVGLPDLAQELDTFNNKVKSISEPTLLPLKCIPEIVFQSYDTEVSDSKSTVLEVQVSSSEAVSYQWYQNSDVLMDNSNFSGVSTNILYINKATKAAKGMYTCYAIIGELHLRSEEIKLTVLYLPEKEQLMKMYPDMCKGLLIKQWPPIASYSFVNLVLIKTKHIDKLNYYTVRGDVDDILESKEVVEYEEVFTKYCEGALVLIEGRPGSGKTTLVHKVASDWAKGNDVLQGAKIVFLVPLRLLNKTSEETSKDKFLLDILNMFYADAAIIAKVKKDIERSGGRGFCFIFDGLDEYRHADCSIVQELLEKKYLHSSMIIVTSRPVATSEIKKCASKRIEVLGFTKQQIYDYISKYSFEEDSMASRLESYLKVHANILHMCYLPVHAAMICFLFSQLEGNIPHTETKIYKQFTITTLLRQRAREKEPIQSIKSFKELCEKDKEQFDKICKLAFQMLTESQQFISQRETEIPLCGDSENDKEGGSRVSNSRAYL